MSERRDLLERIALDLSTMHHATTSPVVHLVAGFRQHCDDVELGITAFDEHPVEVLPHCDDLPSWWAIILSSRGSARFLDRSDLGPEPIISTFARSRDGHEVSLLRRGDALTELPGRAEGRIPDLLRRLLPACTRARP